MSNSLFGIAFESNFVTADSFPAVTNLQKKTSISRKFSIEMCPMNRQYLKEF